ncbi:MAG: thiamine phosphate synthase [Gemmatimonadaceae bacterium]
MTDSATMAHGHFVDRARSVMLALGPRGAVHLRSSRLGGRDFHAIAEKLAAAQEATGCWLIVNDRADIAAAVGARGLQLASHSLEIADALTVWPVGLVGASIHSVAEALAAERAGASWCVAGTVFETPSHAGRPPARVEFVENASRAIGIPLIAIGGVTPEDVPALVKAGAHGVATIRGANWNGESPVAASDEGPLLTRLTVPPDGSVPEAVTRYISAYDSVSTSNRYDYPDGERSPTRIGG